MHSSHDKFELLKCSKRDLIDLIEVEESRANQAEEAARAATRAYESMYAFAKKIVHRFAMLKEAVGEMIEVTNSDFLDEDLLATKLEAVCECAESTILVKPNVKVNARGGVA